MFSESGCVKIDIDNECFVYFLVRNNEVVYVGQTRNGVGRIRQHKDKVFDSVYILNCNSDDLNDLEDMFIVKYNPEYNQVLNSSAHISMRKLCKMVRKALKNQIDVFTDTSSVVRRAVTELGIEVTEYNGFDYVRPSCYEEVLDYVFKSVPLKRTVGDAYAGL